MNIFVFQETALSDWATNDLTFASYRQKHATDHRITTYGLIQELRQRTCFKWNEHSQRTQ